MERRALAVAEDDLVLVGVLVVALDASVAENLGVGRRAGEPGGGGEGDGGIENMLGAERRAAEVEVEFGSRFEENVGGVDAALLSSVVEGGVSVDCLHVEVCSVVDEELRHRSMPFLRSNNQRRRANLVHGVKLGSPDHEKLRRLDAIVPSSHH